jgi:phosphoglycerate dehydrogenase-like enzyme
LKFRFAHFLTTVSFFHLFQTSINKANKNYFLMSSKIMTARAVFAVVSDITKNPAMTYVPELLKMRSRADFIVGNSVEEFTSHAQFDKINAIIWVPPAANSLLSSLWKKLDNSRVKWVHSGFAGVDAIHPFILEHLVQRKDIVVTNAKGAYSRSLAEYAMCATLHFEKQVSRIQRNSQAKVWDKFVMGELHGKTMGFVGFGDIAQATAKIAKNGFGMKIVAMRRQQGGDASGLADACFSSEVPEERLQVVLVGHLEMLH